MVGTKLFGVFDGVSAPYAPKHPPRMFGDDLSGGEMVARMCERLLYVADDVQKESDLVNLVLAINESVRKAQSSIALELDLPSVPIEELAGATFAIAHIGNDAIQIVQAGDTLAVVQLRNGDVIVSPNSVRVHDRVMNAEIERIQREVALGMFEPSLENIPETKRPLVRREMWNRFYHILREARRQDANNPASPRGYGILNGDPRLEEMAWKRSFYRGDVSTIILCTDGVIPWPVMKATNDLAIAKAVLEEFHHRGVAGLLFAARGIEEQNVATAYINNAEATAVAIRFT